MAVKRLEGINMDKKVIIVNEKTDLHLFENLNIIDFSEISDIQSHLELTLDNIKKNDFSDYKTSEPFYMKKFVPLVKKWLKLENIDKKFQTLITFNLKQNNGVV